MIYLHENGVTVVATDEEKTQMKIFLISLKLWRNLFVHLSYT